MKNYTTVPYLDTERLASWYERGRNLLVIGDHGIGKTTIIRGLWDKMGIKYATFSGATLDPWTDLVGIPRPMEGDDGEYYIKYILPSTLPQDIEALFIDEINRSHPKVRNALLELVQFKSINGRVFPNLKVVWAAANPEDTDFNYDVEELDPAQEDRFHTIVKVDTNICYEYFEEKFGGQLATAASSWWNKQTDDVKKLVSPRRLDYAVEEFVDGGDLRDVLPYHEVNVLSLKRELENNGSLREFKALFKAGDSTGAKKFLKNAKKWQDVYRDVLNNYEWADFAIQNMHSELVSSIACTDTGFATLLAHHQKTDGKLRKAVQEMRETEGDTEWLTNALMTYDGMEISQSLVDQFHCVNDSTLDRCVSVPDLSLRLGADSAEELLDKIECGHTGDFGVMDAESCKNTIKFLEKGFHSGAFANVYNKARLKRVALTVLYSVYSDNGSLVPVMYYASPKLADWLCKCAEDGVAKAKRSVRFPAPSYPTRNPFRGRTKGGVMSEEL